MLYRTVVRKADGKETNRWVKGELPDDHYEPCFGKPGEFEYVDVDDRFDDMNNAKQYLLDTDWYVVRKMDTGIAVPEEIEKKRQEARELISQIRG